MLAEDISKLMAKIPLEDVVQAPANLHGGAFDGVEDTVSPFGYKRGEGIDAGHGEPEWIVNKMRYKYDAIFESLGPTNGKVSGEGEQYCRSVESVQMVREPTSNLLAARSFDQLSLQPAGNLSLQPAESLSHQSAENLTHELENSNPVAQNFGGELENPSALNLSGRIENPSAQNLSVRIAQRLSVEAQSSQILSSHTVQNPSLSQGNERNSNLKRRSRIIFKPLHHPIRPQPRPMIPPLFEYVLIAVFAIAIVVLFVVLKPEPKPKGFFESLFSS
ncbi:unnamed protein product [Nesidiocoris tenuis]|uniref:Uncharacterized protein n=1 Tax=Nesidiocoris tenuis TaxID=355587 RepID=A0A6H5GCJ6_9HEMI|nr:unnamed protein product [Nesidiocoris tenuis]